MNAGVIVIVDVPVDRLDHLASRLETVEVAQLMFETSKERFHVTILPGGCHVTDRDLDAARFKIVCAALSHEFAALVGMKDLGGLAAGDSLM